MIKRTFTLHVQDDREKEELLREIGQKNFPTFLYIHAKLNSIKFSVQGDRDSVTTTIRIIKDTHCRVRKRLYPDDRGLYHYALEDIEKYSVSLPMILKVLELLKDRPRIEGNELITGVAWDEFLDILSKIKRILEEVAPITTKQIREVVVPVSVAFEIDPNDVFEILSRKKALIWREDRFKYELIKNKEHTMKEILSELGSDGDEN